MSEPNKIELADGSYILFDTKEGIYRVAFYERRLAKSQDLEIALSLAMKKPAHNKGLREVLKFIAQTSA